MNAGLLVFILLLALSFLGIPIFVALGIGTLVALNMADLPLLVLPQKLFAGMNSSSPVSYTHLAQHLNCRTSFYIMLRFGNSAHRCTDRTGTRSSGTG